MAVWLEETKELPGGLKQASFGMDSISDISELPAISDNCQPGSDAFAVAEKRLVMLGSDGVWR